MKISMLLRVLGGLALCVAALFSATPAFAASASSSALTCTGGAIAPGTYSSINVAGYCAIPTGRVFVNGDLLVATNAGLDVSSPTTQLIVYGNVKVDPGAVFIMGCSPAFGCDTITSDRIEGSLYANRPLEVILHSDSIHKGITVSGGGGGAYCGDSQLFSDFEDNHISGNVVISGVQTCWMGLFRNTVDGSVTYKYNITGSPDGNEIATNYIYGNLACSNNWPAAQVGDSGGLPNHVSGKKLGECAAL